MLLRKKKKKKKKKTKGKETCRLSNDVKEEEEDDDEDEANDVVWRIARKDASPPDIEGVVVPIPYSPCLFPLVVFFFFFLSLPDAPHPTPVSSLLLSFVSFQGGAMIERSIAFCLRSALRSLL